MSEGRVVRVSFVCLGNICRSPTAEAVMRHLVRQAGLEEVITGAVKTGEKVTIPGFVSFERTDRAARQGRNPRGVSGSTS